MKKTLIAALFLYGALHTVNAQTATYSFKPYKQMSATSVKNQQKTGTCWAFSGASFLESEVKRINGFDVDLSEMYVVRHIYRQKCENYVRRQGTAQFGEGGLAHDVMNAIRSYGIVPDAEYPGRKDAGQPFDHGRLVEDLESLCKKKVNEGKNGTLNPDWLKEVDELLDETFGPLPTKFTVDNRQFTPMMYRDYLGIQPDQYITVTSFTHHPFYQPFVLEIPDNFSNGMMYNVPLEDLMNCINHSLRQGYTVQWDADVSNEGFSAKNALALVPELSWAEKSEAQRESTFKYREPQKKITQAYRQEMFDRQVTTDDHLMHITGIETEASNTEIFYTVKNSWGEISDLKGYLRASEPYVRLNTVSVLVHKSALPDLVSQRLGITEGEGIIPEPPLPKPKDKKTPGKPAKVIKQVPIAPKAKPATE